MDNQFQESAQAPLEVARHYQRLLGLPSPWVVSRLVENIPGRTIELEVSHGPEAQFTCPHCQRICPTHDHAAARKWRHLDALQFKTYLTARPPRVKCATHGVVSASLPWADFSARWTIDLEFRVLEVIEACSSLSAAAKLLSLSWANLHRIMERAVERGVARRDLSGLQFLGLDEKSFLRGQSYISVCNDVKGRRVLEVSNGRAAEQAAEALRVVPEEQRPEIQAVATDMSGACIKAVSLVLPNAEIVIDRFHVSQLLNKMVNSVRRAEQVRLVSEGDDTLKGTSRMWLWNPDNMPDALITKFEAVAELNLATSKAWVVKENFVMFWEQATTGAALEFFRKWERQALRLKNGLITKAAGTLRKHLDGLLAYHAHQITNAVSEGFNSKIQALKAAARGFRNFENYRVRILFFCGRLDFSRAPLAI